MCTNYYELHIILNLLLQQLVSDIIFTWKLTFYGRGLKSIAYVALVRKTADEIRITVSFKSFRVKKMNELIVTSNKLTNNFVGLLTSSLRPDVVRGPLVGPC
jgi:hypothetical protein